MARKKSSTGLHVEHVPIDSVQHDPANLRLHPDRNLAAVKASLARFGQQKPIVIDGNGIVRAGNGTLAAAKELGWDTIAIVRSDLTSTEATAYAIADNRSAELAEWDGVALAETLRALQSEEFDLDAVGFTDDEVDAMLEGFADDMIGDDAGRGHRDAGRDDDEPDAEPEQHGGSVGLVYPLAITLTRSQYQEWKQIKAELGVVNDTTAFLKAVNLGE